MVIYLIRHGEKPKDDDDIHLSGKGQLRAKAIVEWFSDVDYLFAADRSKHSNRCVETLTPISNEFLISLNHRYKDEEYKELARELISNSYYQNLDTLVCWHHGNIPALAKALGVKKVPKRSWPDDDFSSVWVITLEDGKVTCQARKESDLGE